MESEPLVRRHRSTLQADRSRVSLEWLLCKGINLINRYPHATVPSSLIRVLVASLTLQFSRRRVRRRSRQSKMRHMPETGNNEMPNQAVDWMCGLSRHN